MKLRHTLMATIVVGLSFLGVSVYANLGVGITPNDINRYQYSRQFDVASQRFVNVNEASIDAERNKSMSFERIRKFLTEGENLSPSQPLPTETPDLSLFSSEASSPSAVWLGHSTFLLRVDNTTILLDPIFGNAAPLPFVAPRFQDPVISREELPPIDVVLISHDHYDHLEMDTIKSFVGTPTQFVVPLGVGRHLMDWGIQKENITEGDWWDPIDLENLTVHITPAQHFSGRRGLAANDTLWASFVIQSSDLTLYFSGDSGYSSHFKAIGDIYGPFDVAFLESGQYNPAWQKIHMMPKDTLQAFKDLNAKTLVPIHWGAYVLSNHAWNDSVVQLSALIEQDYTKLRVPKIGEALALDQPYKTTPWWE